MSETSLSERCPSDPHCFLSLGIIRGSCGTLNEFFPILREAEQEIIIICKKIIWYLQSGMLRVSSPLLKRASNDKS